MFDVVIQGPLKRNALQLADHYAGCSSVNRVIISCWSSCLVPAFNPLKVDVVNSNEPNNPGAGNLNRQIVTSLAGVKAASSNLVLKVRSDQTIHPDDLSDIERYWEGHSQLEDFCDLGRLPLAKIATISISPYYPFFTADFLYFGVKQDLESLFSCKLSPYEPPYNLASQPPVETYLTSQYLGGYNSKVKEFIDSPSESLIQGGLRWSEALEYSAVIVPKAFLVLPKIRIVWEKYFGNSAYGYIPSGGHKHEKFPWRT